MTFGMKFRRMRQNYRIGLNQLALKTGVSNSLISYMERGNRTPKADTLKKLSKGLPVSYNYLLNMAGYAPNSQAVKHPEDYTNGHFDIAKALNNGHYMTWQGKPLTKLDKKMLIKMFGSGESKHE